MIVIVGVPDHQHSLHRHASGPIPLRYPAEFVVKVQGEAEVGNTDVELEADGMMSAVVNTGNSFPRPPPTRLFCPPRNTEFATSSWFCLFYFHEIASLVAMLFLLLKPSDPNASG